MKNKFWLFAAFALASFGVVLAADNKYAKLIEETKATVKGFKFRDTIGTPFSKNWKARFYLDLSFYNPTQLSFPVNLDKVDLVLGNDSIAGSMPTSRELVIDPQFNIFDKIPVEIPLTIQNFSAIQNIQSPRVQVKGRVYQMPLEFTYNLDT